MSRFELVRQRTAHELRLSIGRGLPEVAVLPLATRNGDGIDEYVANGLTAQLIGSLARIPDLLVIATDTMLRFSGSTAPIASIGARLGVRFVVASSIARSEQGWRLSLELHEVAGGGLIWADQFEARHDDMSRTEKLIVGRIVNAIAPQVQEAEIARAMLKPAASRTAYDLMLQALPDIRSLQQARLQRAEELLQRAMRMDQRFAMPYAWAARIRSLRIGQGWSRDRDADRIEAMRLANAAIALEADNSLALATAAHLRAFLMRQYDEAILLFECALSACRNDALAWCLSSGTLTYAGQAAEGRRRAEQAIRLSPLDPAIHHAYMMLALAHLVEGDHAAAESWSRRALAENPHYTSSHKVLAAALAAQQRLREAREVAGELLRLEPQFGRDGTWSPPFRASAVRARVIDQLRQAGALPPAGMAPLQSHPE